MGFFKCNGVIKCNAGGAGLGWTRPDKTTPGALHARCQCYLHYATACQQNGNGNQCYCNSHGHPSLLLSAHTDTQTGFIKTRIGMRNFNRSRISGQKCRREPGKTGICIVFTPLAGPPQPDTAIYFGNFSCFLRHKDPYEPRERYSLSTHCSPFTATVPRSCTD